MERSNSSEDSSLKITRTPFRCTECGKRFSKRSSLLKHLQGHIWGESISYKCSICAKPFKSALSLNMHRIKKHSRKMKDSLKQNSTKDVTSMYKCGICKHPFISAQSLLVHMNRNLMGADLQCEICSKIFTHCYKLKLHHAKHTSSSCVQKKSLCRDKESDKSACININKPGLSPVPLKCSLCPRQYSLANSLRQHVVNVHVKQIDKLVCTVCKKEFRTEKDLRRHVWSHVDSKSQASELSNKLAVDDGNCAVPNEYFYGKDIVTDHLIDDHIRYNPSNDLKLVIKCESYDDLTENSDNLVIDSVDLQPEIRMPYEDLKKINHIKKEVPPNSYKSQCDYGDRVNSASISNKKEFWCSICSRKFRRRNWFTNHVKAHFREMGREIIGSANTRKVKTPGKKVQCPTNKESDEPLNNDTNHQKPTIGMLQSSHFDHVSDNDSSVDSNRCTSMEEKLYSCKVCFRKYASRAGLKYHEKGHLKSIDYQCKHCSKRFLFKVLLNLHLRKVHSFPFKAVPSKASDLFSCKFCCRSFPLNSSLARHVTRKHLNPKKGSLTQTYERPHNCESCSRSFKFKSSLRLHMKVHERPHNCESCGRSFKFKSGLRLHMKVHSVSASSKANLARCCGLCDKEFLNRNHLRVHLTSEHNISCHNTQKMYIVPCASEGRTYACGLCPWKFKSGGHLKEHMFIHTGVYPYKCSLCHTTFKRKSELKKHMNVKH